MAGADPEDEADVAAFDEAMAAFGRGEDRVLSPEEMASHYARPGFLRGLRKGRGLTQAELADKAGSAQGFLSDIEAGRRTASEATIRRISEALGASPGEAGPVQAGRAAAVASDRGRG